MSHLPNSHHKNLLKEASLDNDSNRPIKRRRRVSPAGASRTHKTEDGDISHDSEDSSDFEDVNLDLGRQEGWESDNSDDFEEVLFDISEASNSMDIQTPSNSEQLLTFQLDTTSEEPQKKKKVKFISNEERIRRVLMHKTYIVFLLIHTAVRNSWCNDKSISKSLKQACVTRQISQLLNDDSGRDNIKSRRLLDGIKKLMEIYNGKYRITSQGLLRKGWDELGIVQDSDVVTKKKFRTLVTNFRGNRDVAAQGFVALLRGLGLNARLVVSLQPPDFTIITENTTSKTKQPAGGKGKNSTERFSPKSRKPKSNFEDSDYPIFWVEVWDKFAKHWISVDSIVKHKIEVCSKRRPNSFEPPSGDERNQLLYAVAFDKFGRVRDVTRRYSINYNARVIRKRIEFRSDDDKEWYESVLKSLQRKQSRSTIDIFEAKEFHERDLAEGMPNNMQAFKNHPLYALESQLRQNEVIHPKNESSICGTFRPKNASARLLPVYRRSCVQKLRSARAWYMRGRVLKIGAAALKSKEKIGTDDEDVRLYAEFQTKLYIPPKIEDGKIPKNQYGNIDVYTGTMIPENGVLVRISEQRTMKMLQKTASLLGVDYAKAITSFDFTQRGKGSPHAKEGGIVIHQDNKEALELALNHMIEEEEEERRIMVELNALQNWKYFLLKLRLKHRLNRTHGIVEEEEDTETTGKENDTNRNRVDISRDELDSASDASGDDFGGGFIVSEKESAALVGGDKEKELDLKDELGSARMTRERGTKGNKTYREYSDGDSDIDDNEEAETELNRPKHRRAEYSDDSSASDVEFAAEADDDEESLEFEYESE
ncbi:hypothetical protein CANMA_001875 [Candida margitis]|uniref:uncharacterized protein n=1 Tax=Candida margitis TaxID=1775924 RepID=UPI0022260238|nr:uncharacterized protein CANMA_001875 [Candida margitis]KAI5969071.1 hypothetical protein CANMA_001875 [Candida margitis]